MSVQFTEAFRHMLLQGAAARRQPAPSPADTDSVTAIDRAVAGLCPCGADPEPGSAYCGDDCRPTHRTGDAIGCAMRWAPDPLGGFLAVDPAAPGSRQPTAVMRFDRPTFEQDMAAMRAAYRTQLVTAVRAAGQIVDLYRSLPWYTRACLRVWAWLRHPLSRKRRAVRFRARRHVQIEVGES